MKTLFHTDNAPAAIGPYSQAVRSGNLLFISGQLAIDPATGKLVGGSIGEHTRQILSNIKAILEEAGLQLDNVVKTTIFLTDIHDFAKVNEVYGEFFTDNPPARSTVQVAALPLEARIEIETIACYSGV